MLKILDNKDLITITRITFSLILIQKFAKW